MAFSVSISSSRSGSADKMKLRTAQGKLKIEHSIIDGVRDLMKRLLNENPAAIRSVIPGVIKQVRDARGPVKMRVTVPTTNGWKAIALSSGARQELFISTDLSKEELERLLNALCSGQ
jgi:hypothetical protein